MKKIITIGIGVTLLFAFAFTYKVELTKAVGAFFRSGQDNAQYRTSSAATSPVEIIAGLATSTLSFNTSDCGAITVFTQLFPFSTSSASWLQIARYASDDNVTYWNYDSASTTNLVPQTELLKWKTETIGATSTKVFNLNLIPARYTRLEFGVGTTTSGITKDHMNVWANVACNIQNY